MGPSTNEAVATGTSTQQTAGQAPNPQPKPAPGGSRSDAVSLEVGVKVHGSRVNSTAGATPQTEPFSEETSTMIVFPQGAVVRMTTAVHPGQMLVITNLKSRQDAICRVVKVRNFPNLQCYVEVEFTQPQPKYWGVYFSSEGPTGARRPIAAPPAKAKVTPEAAEPPLSAHAVSPPKPSETASTPQAIPVKPSSSFVSPHPIPALASPSVESGAKNQAAPSAVPQTISRILAIEEQSYAARTRNNEGAVAIPVLPVPDPKPLRDLKPDVEPLAASVEPESKLSREMLTSGLSVSAGRGLGAFGVAENVSDEPAPSAGSVREPFADAQLGREFSMGWRQDWILIAGCAAVLVAAVLGGVWYFHSKTPANTVANSDEPAGYVAQQPTSTSEPTEPRPASVSSAAAASSITAPAETSSERASTVTSLAETPRAASSTSEDSLKSESALPDASSGLGAVNTSKKILNPKLMKAHPLVSLRKNDTRGQAPALDAAAANEPGELSGILSSNTSLPVPAPAGPVTVGGRVKEPRLISSTRPIYPIVAKQAHVEGDVVIDTLLDKNGTVSHVKVVSGPTILRDAALDALRHWRFQPTELDGQPVEVEMFVTIKFRL